MKPKCTPQLHCGMSGTTASRNHSNSLQNVSLGLHNTYLQYTVCGNDYYFAYTSSYRNTTFLYGSSTLLSIPDNTAASTLQTFYTSNNIMLMQHKREDNRATLDETTCPKNVCSFQTHRQNETLQLRQVIVKFINPSL